MKYTDDAVFTTKEMSMDETITELRDCIEIARSCIRSGDADCAIKNLDGACVCMDHLARKVQIALAHVPDNVKESQFL